MKKKISKWKPKLSRKELERRRLAAGVDLKAGMKGSDVARKYGVNPSAFLNPQDCFNIFVGKKKPILGIRGEWEGYGAGKVYGEQRKVPECY